MTNPLCHPCGRPITDNAWICHDCGRELATALADVPWLTAQLRVRLTRQARTGSGGKRAGDEQPLPFDVLASTVADELHNTLGGWVRVITEERDVLLGPGCADVCGHGSCAVLRHQVLPDDNAGAMAIWLLGRVHDLRHHSAAASAHHDITKAVRHAFGAIDGPPPAVYCGPCIACNGEVWAQFGAAFGSCRSCGGQHSVKDRREWMRTQLDDHLGSSAYVAMVSTGLGCKVSPSTVRMWVKRNKLVPARFAPPFNPDGQPRPLYRVGDVVALVLNQKSIIQEAV